MSTHTEAIILDEIINQTYNPSIEFEYKRIGKIVQSNVEISHEGATDKELWATYFDGKYYFNKNTPSYSDRMKAVLGKTKLPMYQIKPEYVEPLRKQIKILQEVKAECRATTHYIRAALNIAVTFNQLSQLLEPTVITALKRLSVMERYTTVTTDEIIPANLVTKFHQDFNLEAKWFKERLLTNLLIKGV